MNLGAILRSCYYLGVSRVIASLKRWCVCSVVYIQYTQKLVTFYFAAAHSPLLLARPVQVLWS